MRVVSLVPGATETIVALGAADLLVGVSQSCDDPAVTHLPRVTRTRVPPDASSIEIDRIVRECLASGESLYAIDAPLLRRLEPDLIVTQGLCDVCAVTSREVHRALCTMATIPRVVSTEPHRLVEVWDSIAEIGATLGRETAARELVGTLCARVAAIEALAVRAAPRPRVAFLEWLDPPMCGGHWNPELVHLAGGLDGIGRPGEPSRTIGWQEVAAWKPDVLCVACCGYGADRTVAELNPALHLPQLADVPFMRSGRIHAFDGVRQFTRPGPGLADSLEALAEAVSHA